MANYTGDSVWVGYDENQLALSQLREEAIRFIRSQGVTPYEIDNETLNNELIEAQMNPTNVGDAIDNNLDSFIRAVMIDDETFLHQTSWAQSIDSVVWREQISDELKGFGNLGITEQTKLADWGYAAGVDSMTEETFESIKDRASRFLDTDVSYDDEGETLPLRNILVSVRTILKNPLNIDRRSVQLINNLLDAHAALSHLGLEQNLPETLERFSFALKAMEEIPQHFSPGVNIFLQQGAKATATTAQRMRDYESRQDSGIDNSPRM